MVESKSIYSTTVLKCAHFLPIFTGIPLHSEGSMVLCNPLHLSDSCTLQIIKINYNQLIIMSIKDTAVYK